MHTPVNATYAGYGRSDYGPTFGGGHDIFTFSGTVSSSGGTFPLNGYLSFGNYYNLNGQNSNSITNNSLQVNDLEVYQVKGRSYHSYPMVDITKIQQISCTVGQRFHWCIKFLPHPSIHYKLV